MQDGRRTMSDHPCNDPIYQSLLQAAMTDPSGLADLARQDWLEEAGLERCPLFVRLRPDDIWTLSTVGDSGIGIGSGRGRGSGGGRGSGSGSGSGSGGGKGSGSGRGRGGGSGSGRGRGKEGSVMHIGKRYLVHCGDWHTFCGLVVGMAGPLIFEMDLVSKISDTTRGDNWDVLASGEDPDARTVAQYKHYKGRQCVPLPIIAFEWFGKLPQEEQNHAQR